MKRKEQTAIAQAVFGLSKAHCPSTKEAALANISRRIEEALLLESVRVLETGKGKHWVRDLKKLRCFVEALRTMDVDGIPNTPFPILMAKGNSKLRFLTFSTIPGNGFCIGAGDCLTFCYSFKSWRFSAAFCRQVMNSILLAMRLHRPIDKALDKAYKGKPVDFRLYVDGDFSCIGDLSYWMSAIRKRPWLRAYGYSKSFRLFLEYQREVGKRTRFESIWPKNYLLNLSSGHNADDDTVRYVSDLSIVRGNFVAVPLGHRTQSSVIGTAEISKQVRYAYGKRSFVCPGKCFKCLPDGTHACGSNRFRGIDITIPIHS